MFCPYFIYRWSIKPLFQVEGIVTAHLFSLTEKLSQISSVLSLFLCAHALLGLAMMYIVSTQVEVKRSPRQAVAGTGRRSAAPSTSPPHTHTLPNSLYVSASCDCYRFGCNL